MVSWLRPRVTERVVATVVWLRLSFEGRLLLQWWGLQSCVDCSVIGYLDLKTVVEQLLHSLHTEQVCVVLKVVVR